VLIVLLLVLDILVRIVVVLVLVFRWYCAVICIAIVIVIVIVAALRSVDRGHVAARGFINNIGILKIENLVPDVDASNTPIPGHSKGFDVVFVCVCESNNALFGGGGRIRILVLEAVAQVTQVMSSTSSTSTTTNGHCLLCREHGGRNQRYCHHNCKEEDCSKGGGSHGGCDC